MTRVGSSEGVAVKISAQDYIGGVRVGLILLDSGRAHGRKWQSDFVSPPAGDRAPERIRRQDRTTPPTDVVMPNQRGAAEFGQEDERGEPDPEWRAVGGERGVRRRCRRSETCQSTISRPKRIAESTPRIAARRGRGTGRWRSHHGTSTAVAIAIRQNADPSPGIAAHSTRKAESEIATMPAVTER